jgi:RNA polymerase sigma factor (sigma-70 family)
VEASALPVPVARGRIFISAKLLRLRSDEQLVALFRAGSDEAFQAIHDRYRQRLFAYIRQMLAGPRQDSEDALQDVFVRAYSALRVNGRPVSLRAWLYRIAHNRCIDQLRRPAPVPTDKLELNFESLQDPLAESERSQRLRELVADVQRLPDQQRSALLMRELQGMSYADLAIALDVSVAAVKSLLLRARTSLIEAAIARDTSCDEIQADLVYAHDHGERVPPRARRHLRDCDYCGEYRSRLRSINKSFAALTPAGPLGIGIFAKLFGGSGAAAGGAGATGSIAGGGTLAGGAATVAAGKVAALVCCAALVTAGVAQRAVHPATAPHRTHHARTAAAVPSARSAYSDARSERLVAARTGGTVYGLRHGGGGRWRATSRLRHHRAEQPLTGQDYPSYPDVVLPLDGGSVKPPTTTPPGTATTQPAQNPIAKLLHPSGSSSSGTGTSSPSGSGTSGSGSASSGSGSSGTSSGSTSSTSGSGSSSTTSSSGSSPSSPPTY